MTGNIKAYIVYGLIITLTVVFCLKNSDNRKETNQPADKPISLTKWKLIKKYLTEQTDDKEVKCITIDWRPNRGYKKLISLRMIGRVNFLIEIKQKRLTVHDVGNTFGKNIKERNLWLNNKLQKLLAKKIFDDFPDENVKARLVEKINWLITKIKQNPTETSQRRSF